MKATQILIEEHRIIERVLTVLEKAADTLESDQDIRPGFFMEATDFIKGFADGCHHRKEEGVLFKAMVKHGMSETDGPIRVMLVEHEQGRLFTRNLRQAATQLEEGAQSAKEQVIQNTRGYAGLLRQHIMKEDNILFPMADQVIPLGEHDQVFSDFERVEHEETGEGVHERYLNLAEKLELELSNL